MVVFGNVLINLHFYCHSESRMLNVTYHCEFTDMDLPPLNAITVDRTILPVLLDSSRAFTTLSLQFRTREESGLILYAQSPTEKYIALELVFGNYHVYL